MVQCRKGHIDPPRHASGRCAICARIQTAKIKKALRDECREFDHIYFINCIRGLYGNDPLPRESYAQARETAKEERENENRST